MEALEIDTVVDSTLAPAGPRQGAAAERQSSSPLGSSESSTLDEYANSLHHCTPSGKGFFEGIFGSPSRSRAYTSSTSRAGTPSTTPNNGDGDISRYWQNYDLSVSEAPKLFSDAEFEAVNRIRQGLEVLVLRKRLQECVLMRKREREVRAVVRAQAIVRGVATRIALPAIREQHTLRANMKKEQKLFKRELRSEGFTVYVYRNKDGALRKAHLKPNGKLNCLCWSMGVAKVKKGSVPLIALKSCYTGYPKHNFPTKAMQARATPLPDKTKTFTIQVDNGKVFVFVSAEEINGPSQKKLVKGLQSIIDEISSPDSFYFDGTGVLRRVTSSIFDDRGNIAHREAMKKQRHERFKSREEDVEERRAALRSQGEAREITKETPRLSSPSLPRPTQAGQLRRPTHASNNHQQHGIGAQGAC